MTSLSQITLEVALKVASATFSLRISFKISATDSLVVQEVEDFPQVSFKADRPLLHHGKLLVQLLIN